MLPTITIEGRLTRDPELRFASSGVAVCSFDVVAQDRVKNQATNEWEDGEPAFFKVTVFGQMGENCAESLTRGTHVLVLGKIGQRKYKTREGEDRTSYQEVKAFQVGPCLQFATARVVRPERGSVAPAPVADDPWASAPAPSDDPPF